MATAVLEIQSQHEGAVVGPQICPVCGEPFYFNTEVLHPTIHGYSIKIYGKGAQRD